MGLKQGNDETFLVMDTTIILRLLINKNKKKTANGNRYSKNIEKPLVNLSLIHKTIKKHFGCRRATVIDRKSGKRRIHKLI